MSTSLLAAALLAAWASPAPLSAGEEAARTGPKGVLSQFFRDLGFLSGKEIRERLAGNTMVSYRRWAENFAPDGMLPGWDDRRDIPGTPAGRRYTGTWRIQGDVLKKRYRGGRGYDVSVE